MELLSNERWHQIDALLDEALDLNAEARAALLDEACANDPWLRRTVERLLAAEAPAFLDADAADYAVPLLPNLPDDIGETNYSGRQVGPYRIMREIGRGGMGTVYKARHDGLGRYAALKFLPPHLAADEAAKERFLTEARAAAALDHPNICTIHDIGEAENGRLFIAMAYYEGTTLKDLIERGPLPAEEAVHLAQQIARGLGKAHELGIVHRDLKPANVMVTEDETAIVLDFGIAKTADLSLTRDGVMLGTAAYMSPEQARGETVDHRTDIWSLGVVLYEMLTGERPAQGENERAVLYAIQHEEPRPLTVVRADVPETLERVVHRALAKDPADRFPDMPAVLAALRDPDEGASLPPTTQSGEPTPSIAVLPFADMSPSRDQGYFCEGMAEEILSALDRIEGLRAAARTSSFQFNQTSSDIRRIGRQLNVGTVLEGSVRKDGGRLRITVRLTDAPSGYRLWAERYDRELEDVFAIQDEIAENTVRALRGVFTEADQRALQQMPKADVRAYDYYLRGRRFFYRQTQRDHEFARQMFARASEVDPTFARAYAGLSDACVLLYKHFDHQAKYLEQADAASRRAVELAPELGEIHASRGLFYSLNQEDDEAQRAFETALRLNPRLYEAYYLYAVHQGCMQGNLERAAELFERAAEIQPDSYDAPLLQAAFCRGLGRHDEARAAYRRGLDLAQRHLELNPDDIRAVYLSANALVALGERERGLEWAARALALTPVPSPFLLYNMAAIHALAGETDRGVDFLERAVQAGYAEKAPIVNDPDLAALRDHPRFEAILRTLGSHSP